MNRRQILGTLFSLPFLGAFKKAASSPVDKFSHRPEMGLELAGMITRAIELIGQDGVLRVKTCNLPAPAASGVHDQVVRYSHANVSYHQFVNVEFQQIRVEGYKFRKVDGGSVGQTVFLERLRLFPDGMLRREVLDHDEYGYPIVRA